MVCDYTPAHWANGLPLSHCCNTHVHVETFGTLRSDFLIRKLKILVNINVSSTWAITCVRKRFKKTLAVPSKLRDKIMILKSFFKVICDRRNCNVCLQ